jgi:AraC-like DNA-binding protein
VAAYAGLSISVLQRRFRAVLHESIHDTIIRSRIRLARELLIGTELPLVDIAEKVGFNHCEYMGSVFKARLGETPAAVRKEYQASHARILYPRPM